MQGELLGDPATRLQVHQVLAHVFQTALHDEPTLPVEISWRRRVREYPYHLQAGAATCSPPPAHPIPCPCELLPHLLYLYAMS